MEGKTAKVYLTQDRQWTAYTDNIIA